MSKKKRPSVPSDSALRNAWSSVALSSGLAVTLSAWTITDRTGAAKLTGTMPPQDGTYLIDGRNRAIRLASADAMLEYFRALRN